VAGTVAMPERPYDVITIGDMCVDLAIDLGDTLPEFGQVERWVQDYSLEMGGSACIFACQAAKLGLRVGILGRVGNDVMGQLILGRLREAGVDTQLVAVDPALKTGLGALLCRPGGDRAILTYGGTLSAVYPEDVSHAFLASGRHLHYCSYYLQTNLRPSAPAILGRAKALGLSVSLDTNWDPDGAWDGGVQAALRQADLFFPNEQEATAIARALEAGDAGGAPVAAGAPGLGEALQALAGQGPIVAVKLGDRGVLVARGTERLLAPVAPVARIVDTIGAGDSFDAGFVAGWLRGLPLAACAAIGNACGRASTQARGGFLGQPWAADLPAWAAHP